MQRLTLIAALAAAFSAHASDGVIEINHAKVMASGGYPYTISLPGSYRLTSDLTQTNAAVEILHIDADGVTLDLNGFSIKGPNRCPPAVPRPCTVASGADGIVLSGKDAVVYNGSIRGVAGYGVVSRQYGFVVRHVVVSESGKSGIMYQQGTVAVPPSGSGYDDFSPALIDHVVARSNDNYGVEISHGTVSNSQFGGNGAHSVAIYVSGQAIDNHFGGAYTLCGLLAVPAVLARGNNFADSATGAKCNGNQSTSTPANSNLCGGAPC